MNEPQYEVYNVNTNNIVSQPAPRYLAEQIAAEFTRKSGGKEYAIREVFDLDTLVEAGYQMDAARRAAMIERAEEDEYERQWSHDLARWLNTGGIVPVYALWFVVLAVIALWMGH